MICSNCGQVLNDDVKYCTKCGKNINVDKKMQKYSQISLIFGIIGLIFFGFLIPGIIGLIFGIKSLKIKKNKMAIVGIILNIIQHLLFIGAIILFIINMINFNNQLIDGVFYIRN